MKKIVVMLAAVTILSQGTAFAEFTDLGEKSEETRQAVSLLTEKNYVKGVSATEFCPDKNVSRAEFAAMALRMLNYMGENKPYYLKDVSKRDWFYYVAGSAAETGLMSGFEDGTFRGNELIPKIQAVTIAARILKDKINTSADDGYKVSEQIPDWAAEYVCIAEKEGITDAGFSAEDKMTRGDAAVMLARVYAKISDTLDTKEYSGDFENKRPPVTIVLDAGHGRDSGLMSDDEKSGDGWLWNEDKGQWGEWRHWKSHTTWQDCMGYGCSGRGNCWYRMENGDRETEPEINLKNTVSAAAHLEEMGYEVRLTRNSNLTNPSMTKRLIYCYPNNDTSAVPDADLFVCIHSNAGGGRGSAYIELSGTYDQADIRDDYAYISNTIGKYINDEIVADTSMPAYCGGRLEGIPELVLFCKSPIPIAYLEIGFFDNGSDLNILQNEYEAIGSAVANGIDKYCKDAGLK